MFQRLKDNAARLSGSALLLMSGAAFADEPANPLVTVLDSVSIDGVATAVAAIALGIVAIALTFKGPDIAKRVIRKV